MTSTSLGGAEVWLWLSAHSWQQHTHLTHPRPHPVPRSGGSRRFGVRWHPQSFAAPPRHRMSAPSRASTAAPRM